MFDRFTEKAIKAVLLAQEETRRLGHKFVGTEQILLGLIAEGTGIAAKVFQEMGIKLKTARIEVEKIIDRGSAELSEEIPFSPRAKIVLELSLQEAEQLGHDYVGTEHLLLGLIREGDGVAIRVLENLRIKPPKVRTSVLRMLADEAEKYEEQLLVSQKLDNNVPEENSSPQPDSNLGELENLQPELASNIYAGLSVHPSSLVQAEVEVPDEWKVGDRLLNLYEVTGILGTGGFGQVYKVLHTGWNISLAVKTPQAEQLEKIGGVENFIREAETWVKLGLHPHIVTCFYVRKLGKSPRVFAEFVGGGSLHDWIYGKDGESPKLYEGGNAESFKRILDIAIQFAWGLHYSHEQGLIHQDVKPGNTMMTPDGTVKVTDFGLARARPIQVSATEGSPDQTLQVEGSGSTPAYCSPEQNRQQTLTRRTDLWSWALSVLEMFKGGRRWDVGVKVAYAREFYIIESEPLQENTPPLSQSVAELLWVCLREDPERRPRTMLDVANALKVIYQQETGEAYPRPDPDVGKDIADSLNNRAVSLLDLGQLEAAMHLWDKALEVNPLHPESTYNRGLILWRSCRITDDILVKDLEKVQDANIGNWNAHYLLALVHLERNNCEEAIKYLNQISTVKMQHMEVQEALALAQERLSKSNRLKDSFQGNPEYPMPIVAVDISSDNRFALCILNYHKALSFYGNHPYAEAGLLDSRVGQKFKDTINKVFIFNIKTGALHCSLGRDREILLSSAITSGCFSPDSNYVFLGNFRESQHDLELWNVEKKSSPAKIFKGHKSFITSVDISQDSKYALSVGGDLKLWDIEKGSVLHTFPTGGNSACISLDSRYILSGSDDHMRYPKRTLH
jgi:serine/threonine protein kinase